MSINFSPGSLTSYPLIPGIVTRRCADSQEGLNEVLNDLSWELKHLTLITCEWINIARKDGVNVQTQIDKIKQTILDAPSIWDPHQSPEIIYRHQLTVRGFYCSQIIRKITKHHILQTIKQARQIPALQSQLGLIDGCEKWLLKKLPGKFVKNPSEMATDCRGLLEKLEEMKGKVLKRAGISLAEINFPNPMHQQGQGGQDPVN
ncbi:hypothetical protein [Candidatus Protochlamydia phocaeensis]|uniref:hypothetical protein n=1 Tax=Candidatus Protochlamydia phocaeensis TaxID=1414722 RepID=UPI0012AB2EC3|nr:hypothetical protein [Candidatus Protochlamydia phocaeensis]